MTPFPQPHSIATLSVASLPLLGTAVDAARTALIALTQLLDPVAGPAAAALAVVVLTVLVRSALLPLSIPQVRGEKTRARLAPRMRELRRRHRDDPRRLLDAQRRLYAEEGASPMGGCLPALAQLPVFTVLYGVFTGPALGGTGGGSPSHTLAGVPLTSALGDVLAGGAGTGLPVFAVLFAVIAAVAWATRRWLTRPALEGAAQAGAPPAPGMGLMSFLPYATVAVAAVVPLAAGLYLATTTVWTLAERLVLRRLVAG
ncbi:membrane protein insertase YidC [Streptomonospora sp. PA3]|uniref:membrane protein insertase YidC n=1 Tax=Streptomonospora sp. PA3 TaxID=2607326 RepID=UPI0012DBDE8A|nr:membrane protein insertase YidC [Streptomonospora sp. PA3]MUL40366.1 membrane protein insertase YidC [Streptomonospora sp. PA3]